MSGNGCEPSGRLFVYCRQKNMKIFQQIIEKYKAKKQKNINKKQFEKEMLEAVKDGKLTKDEIDNLGVKQKDLLLTEDDIKALKSGVFMAAFSYAKSDEKITKEEERELAEIQKYLGVDDSEIPNTKKELARFRLLDEIQKGNLPKAEVKNVILQKDEKAYWSEPGTLTEERAIRSNYGGGSSGMSFRIAKGVTYRIGSHKGSITSEKKFVPVSEGEFIITNKRLIFRGNMKSFAVKMDKILDTHLFTNGFQFTEVNKTKPKLILFAEDGNCNIIGAILSYAINNYK